MDRIMMFKMEEKRHQIRERIIEDRIDPTVTILPYVFSREDFRGLQEWANESTIDDWSPGMWRMFVNRHNTWTSHEEVVTGWSWYEFREHIKGMILAWYKEKNDVDIVLTYMETSSDVCTSDTDEYFLLTN